MALLFVGRFFSSPSSPARTRQSCRTASALRRRAGGKMQTARPCETASPPPPKPLVFALPLPCRPWLSLPSILCQAGPGHGRLWHSRPWQACPWHSRPSPDSCPRCHHWSRLRACARPAEGAPLPAGIMVCLLPASSAGPAPEGGKPGPLPALPSPALRQAGPSKAMLTSMSKRQSGQKESHVKKIAMSKK